MNLRIFLIFLIIFILYNHNALGVIPDFPKDEIVSEIFQDIGLENIESNEVSSIIYDFVWGQYGVSFSREYPGEDFVLKSLVHNACGNILQFPEIEIISLDNREINVTRGFSDLPLNNQKHLINSFILCSNQVIEKYHLEKTLNAISQNNTNLKQELFEKDDKIINLLNNQSNENLQYFTYGALISIGLFSVGIFIGRFSVKKSKSSMGD